MSAHQDAYRRAVVRARFLFRGVPPRDAWDSLQPIEVEVAQAMVEELGEAAFVGRRFAAIQSMDQAMAALFITLDGALPDEPLTQDMIDEVLPATRQAFAQASVQTENALTSGINAAITGMAEGHKQALSDASAAAGVTVSDEAIQGMLERVKARTEGRRVSDRTGTVLIRRTMTSASETTQSFIRDNVGRPGRETAQRLLSDLATDASGETYTRIGRALENQGARGERVRRAIQRAGRAGDAISDTGRNMYPNAQRAMAHELNQAAHEADVLTAQESPAVRALRWRHSARHPDLRSSPDVCDVLEEADAHGLGDGLYHPGSAPSLPHPYCQCAVLPEVADPDEWDDVEYEDDQVPNRTPTEIGPTEVQGILVANVTSQSGPVTAQKVARSTSIFNERLAIAYDEFVDY